MGGIMHIRVEVYRDKAIRAGENNYGEMEIEVDITKLTQEQREILARKVVLELQGGIATEIAVIETLQALVEKEAAEKAEKEAEKIRLINYYLEMPQEEFNEKTDWYIGPMVGKNPLLDEKIAIRKKIVDAEENRKAAEVLERRAADEARIIQRKARDQAASEARVAQIATWVETHGTENQKARYHAELLPESEVLDAIREKTFKSLQGFTLYKNMQANEVCICDMYSYGPCDIEFDDYSAEEATAEEWDRMEEIRKIIQTEYPQARMELREHKGKSSRCQNVVIAKGIRVTVRIENLNLRREYVASLQTYLSNQE